MEQEYQDGRIEVLLVSNKKKLEWDETNISLPSRQVDPTVVHEDNAACIAQLKDGYIKGNKTNHILPKFFFTHDLQNRGDIIVQKVCSSDNQADLFTKALPTTTFKKLVHDTGMRRLNELRNELEEEIKKEGSFVIDHFDFFETELKHNACVSYGTIVAKTTRSIEDSMISNHFGQRVLDNLFENYGRLIDEELVNEDIRPAFS
uniref:Retrovirus-related Pol polyprotein from transposon TNT 1-94 n=1 Tax=Tanacetum cinerariifolium TaxID=118510 RepID=A0A6L2KP86_TANCI|nr:retrovirus-related Pol polyprotein from transposon TNT 1-94 [Tanacetum cinerariifolium]